MPNGLSDSSVHISIVFDNVSFQSIIWSLDGMAWHAFL